MTEVYSIKSGVDLGVDGLKEGKLVFGVGSEVGLDKLPGNIQNLLGEFEQESGQPLRTWCTSVTVSFKQEKTVLKCLEPGYFRYVCVFGQDRKFRISVGKGENESFSTSYEEHVPRNSCLIVYPTISPITSIESVEGVGVKEDGLYCECVFVFFNPDFGEGGWEDDEEEEEEEEGNENIDSELIKKLGEAALNCVSDEQVKTEIKKLMLLAMQS